MRRFSIISAGLLCVFSAFSGHAASPSYPYELSDPRRNDSAASWRALSIPSGVNFGSADVRYPMHVAPDLSKLSADWKATAWLGEKVHTQLLVWSDHASVISAAAGELRGSGGARIPASQVSIKLVRYVMSDGLSSIGEGRALPPIAQRDSILVEDMIDDASSCNIQACTVRPFWLSVNVPRYAQPGLYKGEVTFVVDGVKLSRAYTIEVKNHTLPLAAQWTFKLDLWQNPFSIARYYGVKPWSEEHFELMKPYMDMLAAAGQKNITVSMIHDPWQGQTFDIYTSMIAWTRHADGTWSYDYTVFDKWVEFMTSLGIKGIINCYSMIPWNCRFYYQDEASGQQEMIEARPNSPEYATHWTPMLRDFARHLKAKGWFERTAIAMDERELDDMVAAIKIIRKADPEFKISLAGNFHAGIESDIYDYSIASEQNFTQDVLLRRMNAGLPTTFYTCCAEGKPNTFTFSPPAEATWMAWHTAGIGYNGYLRWAYNCWPRNPLLDSRFGTWSAGDTFFVYPGGRSSIRFERLIEGIQDYEKFRILTASLTADGRTADAERLRDAAAKFTMEALANGVSAADMVNQAKAIVNEY